GVASIIARGLKAEGKAGPLSTSQIESILAAFADRGRVSPWASGDLAVAIKEDILRGQTATVLAPQAGATRAEATAMIARFLRK
ncbi:MAG: S-layer homology domain-containing protein, partial [Actinobacteria bacterium]|nr:S-layer homology domain-containing protein [Actinomycetota bacterium]